MTPLEIIQQDALRVARLIDANNRLLNAVHEYEVAESELERQAAIVDMQHAQTAMRVLE